MYIAVSELLLKPDKKSLASQYHDSLEPHLHLIPGFIREIRCASIDVPNKVLILSWWESAAAMGRWRNQSHHLQIQEKSSRDVFDDYRLRIGPVYGADRDGDVTESVTQPRCLVVLYWRPKQNGQAFGVDTTSELKEQAVARVKAAMLENATYETGDSILRLSVWASQDDAMLYEKSVVRVERDSFERVCVERDYSKERRDDAPGYQPGR